MILKLKHCPPSIFSYWLETQGREVVGEVTYFRCSNPRQMQFVGETKKLNNI